jgi:DNA-directed RNA polymerase subunit RPC12/RpoP
MPTYHGITKAICLNCGKVTQDITALEILNDSDANCTACNMHAVAWHTQGEIIVTAQGYGDDEPKRYTVVEVEACQLCGKDIADISTASIVLPWGLTCSGCVKDIDKDPALNCECGYGH